MRIAVIDDDPVETVLLSELSKDISDIYRFESFSTLNAFLAADTASFDIAFLDRRIPPHEEFADSLPLIASTEFRGRVVLMTAHDSGTDTSAYDFEIIGPVEKLDLLNLPTLEKMLTV